MKKILSLVLVLLISFSNLSVAASWQKKTAKENRQELVENGGLDKNWKDYSFVQLFSEEGIPFDSFDFYHDAYGRTSRVGDTGYRQYINGYMKSYQSIIIGTGYRFPDPLIVVYQSGERKTIGKIKYFADGVISSVKVDLTKAKGKEWGILNYYQRVDSGSVAKEILPFVEDSVLNYYRRLNASHRKANGAYLLQGLNHESFRSDYFYPWYLEGYPKTEVFDKISASIKDYCSYEIVPYVLEIENNMETTSINSDTFKLYSQDVEWYDKPAEKSLFRDVADNHWAVLSINQAKKIGLVDGIGNSNYGPELALTKAQVVQLLYKFNQIFLKDTKPVEMVSIGDVEESDWFSRAIQWAVANKLVDLENNRFNPNQAASRAFTAITISRLVGPDKLPYFSGIRTFPDVQAGSELESAIKSLQKAEVIQGLPNGEFGLEQNLTRSQAAKIMDRLAYAVNEVLEGEYNPQTYDMTDYYDWF